MITHTSLAINCFLSICMNCSSKMFISTSITLVYILNHESWDCMYEQVLNFYLLFKQALLLYMLILTCPPPPPPTTTNRILFLWARLLALLELLVTCHCWHLYWYLKSRTFEWRKYIPLSILTYSLLWLPDFIKVKLWSLYHRCLL